MRIHRIRLTDFRGVADREVSFALDGVTIVEGPNEAGKTSVAEAIDLVLHVPDSSTAQRVKDIRPVGRDVGPRVEIELTTGPYHLVYAKRWLHQRSTTLTVTAPRREQLAGREAHDRVSQILDETIDADLWAALRLQQGAELTQAAFDTPALNLALEAAAGGAASAGGAREDDLLVRIQEERDRYWTATGKPRVERVERSRTVAAARARVDALAAELSELDAHAERVAAIGRQLEELRAQRLGCVATLDAAEAAWSEADAVQRDLVHAEQLARAATSHAESARAAVARRDELVDDVRTTAEQLDKLVVERERTTPALVAAEARADVAAAEAASLEAALVTARGAADEARRHLAALQAHDELDDWRQRAGRIAAAEASISRARAVLDAHPLDVQLLPVLESAHLAAAEATARLEVAGARITAQIHAPVALRVEGAAEAVLVGDEREWVVTDRFTLDLDDAVTVVVEPGHDARELARAAETARRELHQALDAAGVASLDEARSRADVRRRAEADLAEAGVALRADLGDLTPSLVGERVAELEAIVADHDRRASSGRPTTVGAAVAAVEQAERRVGELEAARDERAADEQSHRDLLREAVLQDRVLDHQIEQARQALQVVERRLAAARAEIDDHGLLAALSAADAAAAEALAAERSAAGRLAGLDPEALTVALDNARAAVRRVDEAVTGAEAERARLVTLLDVHGERGLATELEHARTELVHLTRAHERVEARAAAAGLLAETFERHRSDTRQRYVAPFRAQIERLGRIVFGPDVEIELDDELRIARRTVGGATLDFDQLSVGAREQLGLLARLACASIVSADGGAPVIFDDVLGYTDPERLRTMGAAIAAASPGCQVIILTCTPGRYASIGNARVVSIGE